LFLLVVVAIVVVVAKVVVSIVLSHLQLRNGGENPSNQLAPPNSDEEGGVTMVGKKVDAR
jgi:hypothetical protein